MWVTGDRKHNDFFLYLPLEGIAGADTRIVRRAQSDAHSQTRTASLQLRRLQTPPGRTCEQRWVALRTGWEAPRVTRPVHGPVRF